MPDYPQIGNVSYNPGSVGYIPPLLVIRDRKSA